MVRRDNPDSSPPSRLQGLGVDHPAVSASQELAPWRQAIEQPAPGLSPAEAVEAQRPLAHPCGRAHRAPAQRDESGEQGREPRLPHRGSQGGLHRSGSLQVRTRSALHETASPENTWWVENAAVWGPDRRPTRPRGLAGYAAPGDPQAVRLDTEHPASTTSCAVQSRPIRFPIPDPAARRSWRPAALGKPMVDFGLPRTTNWRP